jgi:hypothetical protein
MTNTTTNNSVDTQPSTNTSRYELKLGPVGVYIDVESDHWSNAFAPTPANMKAAI